MILNAHEEHLSDHSSNNNVLSLPHIISQASLEFFCLSYLIASAPPELSKNKASHYHAWQLIKFYMKGWKLHGIVLFMMRILFQAGMQILTFNFPFE